MMLSEEEPDEMARSLKITSKVGEEILRLSTEYSQRQIAEKLREKHGVQLSHTAIAKFIKAQRWERSAQTKAIVREHLRISVPTDLEILQETRDQLNELRKSGTLDVVEQLRVIDRLNDIIQTRLKFSGADAPDRPDEFAEMTDEELEAYVNGTKVEAGGDGQE